MKKQCLWMACAVMLGAGAAAPAFAQSPLDEWGGRWHVTVGGFSKHARDTLAPGRQWQETHAGMGFQRRLHGIPWNRDASSDWNTRLSFGTLEDSRGFLGSYTGMGFMREFAHFGTFRFEAGANAAVHYRSHSWSGAMHLVPVVMPALSLTEYRSGFGLDLSWVPPVAMGNAGGISTLLLQLSYRPAQ